MAKRVVCVELDPPAEPHDAAHVSAVGIGSIEGSPEYRETVEEVRTHIDDGGTYYAKLRRDRASVEPHECPTCGFSTVRIGDTDVDVAEALPRC